MKIPSAKVGGPVGGFEIALAVGAAGDVAAGDVGADGLVVADLFIGGGGRADHFWVSGGDICRGSSPMVWEWGLVQRVLEIAEGGGFGLWAGGGGEAEKSCGRPGRRRRRRIWRGRSAVRRRARGRGSFFLDFLFRGRLFVRFSLFSWDLPLTMGCIYSEIGFLGRHRITKLLEPSAACPVPAGRRSADPAGPA